MTMLNREQIIAIARGIGWDVQKESGKIAEFWTVSNTVQSYDYQYLSDFDAWGFVINQILGGRTLVFNNEPVNTNKRDKLLNEMMHYVHPSLLQDKNRGLSKGNVYAWHERKEGNKEMIFSLSVGFEVATGMNIALYALRAEVKDNTDTSRERAMEQVYQKYQEWIVTQKPENPMTWSLQQEHR